MRDEERRGQSHPWFLAGSDLRHSVLVPRPYKRGFGTACRIVGARSKGGYTLSKRHKPLGSLTVITGSMFSGKTEELIRLVRRAMHARKRVQVFKSAVDVRCDTTVIRTHDGWAFNAVAVADSAA